MYHIKISYQTGDSFHNEDREEYIEHEWENEEAVMASLQYINEHYQMVEEFRDIDGPRAFQRMKVKYGKNPWFYTLKDKSVASALFSIRLMKDDESMFVTSVFWTGYFDTLYGASIEGERY